MKLNFKVVGEGTPLVILHGVFGSLDNWQTIARKLSDRFQVFTVDLRNHGKSPHSDEHSYTLMSEDIALFFQENSIEKAHLIGHSMGGKVAMQFTLNNPNLVDHLIVVDIATRAYRGDFDDIFDALFKLDLKSFSNRHAAEEQLIQYIKEERVRQFLLKNLTRNKDGGFRWKMNLDGLYKNFNHVRGAISSNHQVDTQTLVIAGGDSNYVGERDIADFEKLFSNVRVEIVPNAGHWVHAEAPEAFLKLVIGFLAA